MSTKKILIVYASGFGSTEEVAQVMANELRTLNFQVEVQPAETARPPVENEAVIIGSAIRYDRWLSDARNYLDRHQKELSAVPVAYFYSCLTLAVDPTSPDTEQVYDATLLALQPSIKPIMVGGFAGAPHYEAMPWYFRLILGLISTSKGLTGSDYRNWQVIKDWVNQLAGKL